MKNAEQKDIDNAYTKMHTNMDACGRASNEMQGNEMARFLAKGAAGASLGESAFDGQLARMGGVDSLMAEVDIDEKAAKKKLGAGENPQGGKDDDDDEDDEDATAGDGEGTKGKKQKTTEDGDDGWSVGCLILGVLTKTLILYVGQALSQTLKRLRRPCNASEQTLASSREFSRTIKEYPSLG